VPAGKKKINPNQFRKIQEINARGKIKKKKRFFLSLAGVKKNKLKFVRAKAKGPKHLKLRDFQGGKPKKEKSACLLSDGRKIP